jgi:large subunit ribosomal protein L21
MSNTYAIVETGSKQYRVEPKSLLEVELLEVPEGQKEVSLDKVLLIHSGDKIHVGTPVLEGAKIICDYLGDFRAKKVIHFRFRRRKNSRVKKGHRQDLSRLRVKEIKLGA